MRAIALLVLVACASCQPGGVKRSDELCARAGAMYARCETRDGMDALQWDLVIDRWRSLCRAAITGETKQLLPDALAIWSEMGDDVRAGMRVQAECTAAARTCDDYRRCDE